MYCPIGFVSSFITVDMKEIERNKGVYVLPTVF